MGFFSDLFGGGGRRQVERLLNPLLSSKRQEFAVVHQDDVYMKHYFRFRNPEGRQDEFVVIYRRLDPELHYLHTHHRKSGESFFVTVNERVWSISISYLIDQGKRLAPSTPPRKDHLAATVSAGILRHPDWKPPETTPPPEAPRPAPAPPYEGTRREAPKAPIVESNGFRVNEHVVYPAHGVGQILAIEEQEIAGAKLNLFVIIFLKDKMTLRVPTAKVANVGMRKLSDPTQVQSALEILKAEPIANTKPWAEHAEEVEAKINSGDINAIAEVIRDLHLHDDSYSARQLYEAAVDRLSREIAIVQHATEKEAILEIDSALAKQASPIEEKSSAGNREGGQRVSVDVTPWEISTERYNEIGRVYEFHNLAGPGRRTRFDIRCRLTVEADRRTITPFLYFVIEPHILEQAGLLAAMFAPNDALVDYKIFTIKVEPIATGANFLLMVNQADTDQCLQVLMLGRQIMFRLMSEKEQLGSFPLENDRGFSESYHQLRRMLST